MRWTFVVLAACGGAVTIEDSAEWEAVRSSTSRVSCEVAGDVSLGEVPDGAIVQVYDCDGQDCNPVTAWRLSYGEIRARCSAGSVYRVRVLEPVGMRWRGAN